MLRTMNWRARTTIAALLLGAAAAAWALTPAQKTRLDAAVHDYDAGRIAAARTAFEALAHEQVPAALFNLGVMHLRGEMPRPDRAAAERLLQRAAAGGFVTAMVALARGLETGAFGARDLAAALRWFELAAQAGSVEAQLETGTAAYLGRGRPRDAAAAAHWFREAAKGGDIGAMYLLASMYEAGDGVPQDLRLARYWYALAASRGDEAAPGKLKAIDEKLAAQPS